MAVWDEEDVLERKYADDPRKLAQQLATGKIPSDKVALAERLLELDVDHRKVRLVGHYDPVTRRWRVGCPLCAFESVRAKQEASEHHISMHLAYEHEVEVKR